MVTTLVSLQDANNDTTSRKGDEEEGNTNVRKIPIGKRYFEFYDAPFTKFWFNTVRLPPPCSAECT